MIKNDEELASAVEIINDKFREIQNYLGDSDHDLGKIKFPRRYVRTATYYRNRLPFINELHVRDNLAYALIQTDVYRWLTNRTDLFGVAREMIIKSGIALLGSVCETIAVVATRGIIGRKHSFCQRCTRMVVKNMISQEVCNELQWLWETRAAIHIYQVEDREYEKYSIADYNRAVKVTWALCDALDEWSQD